MESADSPPQPVIFLVFICPTGGKSPETSHMDNTINKYNLLINIFIQRNNTAMRKLRLKLLTGARNRPILNAIVGLVTLAQIDPAAIWWRTGLTRQNT